MGTNEYRAKDEALFLKFVNDTTNNKWTVTDKSGTVHTFGDSSSNRQTNALGTFKWALCKVKDTSGNYMTVSYATDNGQLYLSTVEYNGNETQSFAHSHKVEFTLEDRDDDGFSYATGAKVSIVKRLNNIQVKAKDGSSVYQLARKYVLGYEYSAATKRSRLITVTEYGKDGTTSLPVTTFVYHDKVQEFESMTDAGTIYRMADSDDYDYIRSSTSEVTVADLIDVDGDGINDRLQSTSTNSNWNIQYGSGSGYGSLVNFYGTLYNPSSSASYRHIIWTNSSRQQVTDFVDINGDGLPDRIISQDSNTSWTVQLNSNALGFESANSSWGTISRMVANTNYDHIRYSQLVGTAGSKTFVDFFDINGDGLPDRVMAEEGTNYFKVQLNTGTGFASMQTWGNTERMTASAPRDAIRLVDDSQRTLVDMVDLNGDGLQDRVQADYGSSADWKVQWNTGSGFTTMESWGPIVRRDSANSDQDVIRKSTTAYFSATTDFFDLNGDGLPDRVQGADENTVWKIQWNTGTGFTTTLSDFGTISKMDTPVQYSYPRWADGVGDAPGEMADFDGDGLPDRIQAKASNTAWKIQKNKGPFPDLLKEIKNGRGGKTTVSYGASTAYDNRDTNNKERLPFPVQVVTQVDQADGMGNTVTTIYSYKGGMYDATAREFRGFREVTVTDAVGTKTINTFGQDDHNKGKLLQKEVRDSSNNLFSKEVTTWSDTHPYTGVHFVYVSQIDNYVYDGDASYKQTRQTFTYDTYGNLASTTEEGDISVSTDSRKTVNAYTYNTTDYILNTLKKTTLYDTDLTTIKAERYFYYDSATSIDTAPVKGLLTKEEEWLSTASGCGTAGPCTNNPKTTMTYDSYGNVATVQDARTYTTTNTYDSTYHLFLTQISNALTQTRSFTYDAWLAQILTSTDQNSRVTETVYDTLGRVTKIIEPLDSSSEPTKEFSYDYPASNCTTCTTKVTTKVKSSVPGQTFTQLISYSFTDGLGREIQQRSPSEDSDQIVSGIVTFNSRGLIDKQYVPYFATSSTSYVAVDTSKPKATFTYDAVGRRTRIDYPDSTNSQVAFSDFVKTTTDQRGKQLRYTNDAYGRLVKTEEFNSGSTYTTTYEYDVLNNLKKTTDNAASETTITYDSLSRKTAMTDPDMSSWTYAYDLNDNLTSQVDAKSQTISFTYDALNRVTLKDLPSGETDATYSYDSAPTSYSGQTGYWVGRLVKVSDASGDHEFLYDKEGAVLKDKKTISGTGYEFVRTYDSMGRVRTLTYPDTEVVTYAYNGFGDVETISGVKNSVTTDYIKDVDYNASGQITFLKYGNDVTSNYTYNANTLRLSSILTEKSTGVDLQNLSYTFDNNGNVASITDTINSMSQTFTYDDLNRLTQAVGSAYGTQNFTYDSIGNMTSKAGRTMVYGEGTPGPHAVTSLIWTGTNYPTFARDFNGSCALAYDANGNMTTRGQDALAYDSENRLKELKLREGTTGTTNYTLKAGWNVISFTHLPDNKAVSTVLSSLTFGTDYNQVSTWDSASGTWKHWVNDSDFNDFTEFQYGKTYEIYVNSGTDESLSVTGTTNGADLTHNIVSGDNFISPAVKTATNVTTVLAGLTQGTHYSDVKRFNATTQTWESYAGSAFTQFEPGKGYNIIGLTTASFSYGKTETVSTFVYDSTDQRVKKTVGSTTTTYLGKDYDVTGSTSTKYIFLGDRRVSTKDSGGTLQFIHDDHISSSNIITDSSGNQAGMYEYDPYGSTATHTGSASVKHQFTGQENDDSSKLYYYGARYYDPQLGRFISPDWYVQRPSDPQSLNRYSYARNNPIKYTDPTGNFWFVPFLIAAAVGATVSVGIAAIQGNLNSGNFLKIAGLGALSGVVGYATGGAAGALLKGITGSGFITAVLSGAASGFVSNGAVNLVQGRSFTEGAFEASVIGGVAGGAGYAGGKMVEKFRQSNATTTKADTARLGLAEDNSAITRNAGKIESVDDVVNEGFEGIRIPGPGQDLFSDMSQLQHVYDRHAGDFGLFGNKNLQSLGKLAEAISSHVQAGDTRAIQGLWKNQPATFYTKPNGLTVITKPSGELISGFKFGEEQLKNLKQTGKVK